MYEHYQLLCFTVQYLANTQDSTKATQTAACQELISILNVLHNDAKKRYLQRTGKLTADENESGSNSEATDNS